MKSLMDTLFGLYQVLYRLYFYIISILGAVFADRSYQCCHIIIIL